MKINFILYTILIFSIFTFYSCTPENKEKTEEIDDEVLDPNSSLNTNFDGKIFSIPSPIQTSLLLKEEAIAFNEGLMNLTDNLENYTNEVKKALNLGVYGTDMGYINIYNKNSTSLKYLKCIEKITSDLDLEGAFDKNFMERFEKNNTNQDSLIKIVSDAFQKSDAFLKNNDRKNTSVLILTGGWIESLYLACELNKQKYNKKLVERIGEQKQTLNTIIEILDLYNKNGINDELLVLLEDLKLSFNLVKLNYDFVPPTTNKEKKLTVLNHVTEVDINSSILNMITIKINKLRSFVVE
ncbi:MAG: hypothetical protein HYU67_04310 [Flavobacteriia bacterium]|nr:hypothetical protein [Flavobacteriia bacterium]